MLEHFSLPLIVVEIFADLEKVGQVMMYNTHRGAIRCAYLTSYLMAIIMFDLSLTVYEIFANLIKEKSLILKTKSKMKKEKNEICAI